MHQHVEEAKDLFTPVARMEKAALTGLDKIESLLIYQQARLVDQISTKHIWKSKNCENN